MTLFTKILIANRGEIACRILRSAKKLGISTVAIFSEADCNAMHVSLADEAYLVGPAISKESYLNIPKIIAIAKLTKCDAIHPGYGFLSENSEFAKACENEEIVFVGPSSTAIELMANKNVAKEIMQKHHVPILTGHYNHEQSAEDLLAAATKIGYPIVLKAIAGGGGKGLRLVNSENEFQHAYEAVCREAKAFFNDDKILVEKYLPKARHVEVQILADHHGNIKTLGTRDCSIQRRHQKIIEEAPAPNISSDLQNNMFAAAINAAKAIHYSNAGTIEFLVEDENFYFMEMNTRLQVEHPVTEMIFDVDIVEWQLRVAAGETLFDHDLNSKGHAIEVRLNAEDPQNNFLPSAGKLAYFHFPLNEYLRIDSGYTQGDTVNIYYDSLLAKLIVWGKTRNLAIQHLKQALSETATLGIATNLSLLKNIIDNQNFIIANINTHFLQVESFNTISEVPAEIIAIASLSWTLNKPKTTNLQSDDLYSPWNNHDGWQLYFPPHIHIEFSGYKNIQITADKNLFTIKIKNNVLKCILLKNSMLEKNLYQMSALIEGQLWDAKIFYNNFKLEIVAHGENYLLQYHEDNNHDFNHEREEQLLAPMPGTVVALLVNSGQKVTKGDKLVVIEAMKMEHTLYAPKDGIIKQCYYKIGDLIKEGSELLEFE